MELSRFVGATLVLSSVIAGIQAAPDLMNAGFKVYLRDESPSISRTMAKPAKIFQTNEQSYCILTSRLAGAGRRKHRISHQRKAKSSSGEAGKFKLKPIIEPRYVDEEIHRQQRSSYRRERENFTLFSTRQTLPQSCQGSSNHNGLSVPQHEI